MNRKLFIIVLLAAFIAAFFLLRGKEKKEIPKVVVKASEGLMNRKMKNAQKVTTMQLSTAAYDFLMSGDTLFYIPYDDQNISYLFQIAGQTIPIKQEANSSINAIQKEGDTIWLYEGSKKQLLSYRKGNLEDAITLKGSVWRAFVKGNQAVYISWTEHAPGYFYLLDLKTKEHTDSVPIARVFSLPDDDNLNIKVSGNFFGIPNTGLIGYQPTKSSFSVFFDLHDFSAFKIHQSIDSLPFPQIIDEQIMEGITRKKPVPGIHINAAATAAPKTIFLLSSLNSDTTKPGKIIDAYSFPEWQYQHSYNLNEGERSAQGLYFQPSTNLLWVLYDDRKTLVSYQLNPGS